MATPVLKSVALADQLAAALVSDITNGKYPLGSRLPTEEKLAAEFGVSRSVVREAIARMKSDGLVTTRQGLGAFVADSLAGVPFRIPTLPEDARREIVEIFELRIAIEAEAAAMAAERATPEQLEEIRLALLAVTEAAYRESTAVEEDLRFHRAIAVAANNRLYMQFSAFLELHVRNQLNISLSKSKAKDRLPLIKAEHEAIYEAIRAKNPDAARKAIVTHLRNGIARLHA